MIVPYLYHPSQIFGVPGQVQVGAFKARDVARLMMGDQDPYAGFSNAPKILSSRDAELAHCTDYLDQVIDGGKNGFGRSENQETVTAIRYAAGNFLASVDLAMGRSYPLVMSLSSGFHHAGFDYGWGFCTFNALMIAVLRHIRSPEWDFKPVLILDGDAHFGDGCVDIIDHLALKDGEVVYRSVPGFCSPTYAEDLRKAIGRIEDGKYGLVLYQPGADSLIGDIMGAGSLDRTHFMARDLGVFEAAVQSNTPLVFNLAGGYGAPDYKTTLMTHYQTWKTAGRAVISMK